MSKKKATRNSTEKVRINYSACICANVNTNNGTTNDCFNQFCIKRKKNQHFTMNTVE